MNGIGNVIILFRTTHDAIKSEKVLLEKGFKPKVIPVPRELSAQCGIALEIDGPSSDAALALLKEAKIHIHSTAERRKASGR